MSNMKQNTQITTRAEALAALGDLTDRELEAVRVLLACAWVDAAREMFLDNDPKDTTPQYDIPYADGFGMKYARQVLPPKTVTRPRRLPDPRNNGWWWSVEGGAVRLCDADGDVLQRWDASRTAVIADLLANPTETVAVDV